MRENERDVPNVLTQMHEYLPPRMESDRVPCDKNDLERPPACIWHLGCVSTFPNSP